MKRIVITGATSFIGIHLIQEWIKEDCEIIAVIRRNSPNANRILNHSAVRIIELNMEEYDQLPGLIGSADCFYHLAWEGARQPYRDDPVLQQKNYFCTIEAFHAAQETGCSFFLGSGSQAEYGIMTGLVDEETLCQPVTEYGKQKLHCFETLSEMADKTEMKFIWTRIFSIYGLFDYSGTLVMQCLRKMQKNERIEMTEGTQLWDFLHVHDAARAMKAFALSDCENGVYILASGDHRPLREYVIEMKETLNSESELVFGAIPYGRNGPVNLTPNPQKTMNALGWKPEISFSSGIKNLSFLDSAL